ncbi:MAG: alkaline phosphatase family protein [Planctomycetota bacterium]
MITRTTLSIAALALTFVGCSDHAGDARRAQPLARVVVVGADGLEWNVLRPLLASGECPNLRALMERGSFGRLETLKPTLSPMLWTTVATGKTPAEHEIAGFIDRERRQYTSTQRRGRAVWNIADRYGLSSNVVGWFITWPVDPIRGAMVSGSSSTALIDANWKPALMPDVPDQVHPASLTPRVMEIAKSAGSATHLRELESTRVFGDIPKEALGSVERRLRLDTRWSIQADATFFEVTRMLLREQPADLNLVYFGGTDVVGHRFWRYYQPEQYRWPGDATVEARWRELAPKCPPLAESLAKPEGAALLAPVIPNYYRWFDAMLGELVSAAGPDATIVVLSDHGMHAVSTDMPSPDCKFITGHHEDAPPGVIIAAGPGIARQGSLDAFLQRGELATHGGALQVMPTLLALLGIPPAADSKPRAIVSLFDERARANAALAPVASHDDGFRVPFRTQMASDMDRNFIEKYKALGYIGDDADEAESAPK